MTNAASLLLVASRSEYRCQEPPCDSPVSGLELSDRFSNDQTATAQRIWTPFLRRLASVLGQVKRLECSCTPNGLILESPAGWILAMCCLDGANVPHVISIRSTLPGCKNCLKALGNQNGFLIKSQGKEDAALKRILRMVMTALGCKLLKTHIDFCN